VVTWNGKFDSHFSLTQGIELGNKMQDGMIAAALLDENRFSYSLSNTAKTYNDIPHKKEDALYSHISSQFGCAPDRSSMANYHKLRGDDPIAVDYACYDTLVTLAVHGKQQLPLYEQRLEVVYDLENRLSHVLRKMERRGVCVDEARLEKLRTDVDQMSEEIQRTLPLTEDCLPMNTRSNKDLQNYFEMHNISDWEFTSPTVRNPDGKPSFNKTFLAQSEPGNLLIQARAFEHFKSSFLEPIQQFIHGGKVYTNFNQTQGEFGSGTKTGRLSCTKPNMQQVSKRDEQLGRMFRSIFTASPGFTMVEFDYSQAEPRLFTHYSEETVLLEGYNKTPPVDMHSIAAEYMGITRGKAKGLNLALQYQMGQAKLAKQLGITPESAKEMYQRWRRTFPNVAKFTRAATEIAEQRGYVKTILGRRARFPDPKWAYRAANRIVQGGSADILKYMMVKIDDYLVEKGLEDDVRMLLTIHDSILFEISDSLVGTMVPTLKAMLEDVQRPPFSLKVPFVAEYASGKDWAEVSYGVAA
jgi:DNA polymerase-1